MTRSPSRARGVSLIELMIALAVIAYGVLAMWHLHVFGLTSTAAARRQTVASQLAAELAAGLERLPFSDPRVVGTPSTTAPVPFGPLVDGSGTIASGAGVRVWDDANPVPGVRPTTEMRELAEASARFERRWTVWSYSQGGPRAGAAIVAVSVTWRDPPFQRPREVVRYTYVPDPSIVGLSLGSTP